MAITTRESVSGFIASEPQLSFTQNGDARFYARIGQEHAQRADDGTFTQLEPTFTDLVLFGKSAERAYGKFQKGDPFLAEGQARSYTQNVDGNLVERDQFVARRIGHDNNRSTYTVDRTRPEREAPATDRPDR
jgi:single-stranded DNA-binding protein